MGDPTRAQPEHGERIIQRTVEVGLELLTVLQQQRENRRIAAAKMEDKNE
jgi:creatinine amidohydrolase/Fe(II)-dependent formamide hydrolase-like protein